MYSTEVDSSPAQSSSAEPHGQQHYQQQQLQQQHHHHQHHLMQQQQQMQHGYQQLQHQHSKQSQSSRGNSFEIENLLKSAEQVCTFPMDITQHQARLIRANHINLEHLPRFSDSARHLGDWFLSFAARDPTLQSNGFPQLVRLQCGTDAVTSAHRRGKVTQSRPRIGRHRTHLC